MSHHHLQHISLIFQSSRMSSASKIVSPDSSRLSSVRYKRRARKTVPARFVKKMSSPGSPSSLINSVDPVLGESIIDDVLDAAYQEALPPVLCLEYGSWSGVQESSPRREEGVEEPILEKSENPNPIIADSVVEEIRVSTQEEFISEKASEDEVVPSTVEVDEEIEITSFTVADMFEAAKNARDQRRDARKRKKIEVSSKDSSKKRKVVDASSQKKKKEVGCADIKKKGKEGVVSVSQASRRKKKEKQVSADGMTGSPIRVTRSSNKKGDVTSVAATPNKGKEVVIEAVSPARVTRSTDVSLKVDDVPETKQKKKKHKSKGIVTSLLNVSSQFLNKEMEAYWSSIIQKNIYSQKSIDLKTFKQKTNLLPVLEKGGLLGSVTLQGSFVKKVIQEFYCNLSPDLLDAGSEHFHKVFIRGKFYEFSPEIINAVLRCSGIEDTIEIDEVQMWLELTYGNRMDQSASKKVPSSVLTSSYAVSMKIALHNWSPSKHTTIVPTSMASLLYKIKNGLSVDMGQRMFDLISVFTNDSDKLSSSGLPFPLVIYHVLTSQGFVKEDSDVEEQEEDHLSVDNRIFGGNHYNDMKMEGIAAVMDKDTAEAYLRDKLVQIDHSIEELEVEMKRIGKLLLAMHKTGVTSNVPASAEDSEEDLSD